MSTEQRRLVLRLVTKLLLLIFVTGLLAVFLRSLPGRHLQEQHIQIDLGQLQTEQPMRYDWNGKRIVLLKRNKLDLAAMQQLTDDLLDPKSNHSIQPVSTENILRSVREEYFIALDYGTDLNCELEYLHSGQAGPSGQRWLGGFKDRCRGSWYDPAGRVYKGQEAKRNLTIPPYQIKDRTLLLGAE